MTAARNIGDLAAGVPVVISGATDDIEAFDALPLPVRAALTQTTVNIAAAPLLDFWRDGPGDCLERLDALLETIAEARWACPR